MKKIFTMVLFLCANILSAQWVNMSIPEDCFEVNILYKTESGRIYAATNTGIYLSTDFGSRWNYISQDLKNDGTVTCIAGNDSLLFAGVYTNGLYKTSNNGINWTKVLYDNNQYLIPNSILIKDNAIYLGSFHYIHKSTNNGVNWQRILQPPDFNDFSALKYNNNFIFALGSAGSVSKLYRSSDNGQTWEITNGGSEIFDYGELECCNEKVYVLGFGEYMISTNNGESFTPYGSCNNYAFLSNSEDNITSGDYGKCKIITSCGTFFIEISNGLAGLWINDFITSGQSYLLATSRGFYKSTNAGLGWYKSDKGIFSNRYTGCGSYSTLVLTSNSINGKIYFKDLAGSWSPAYGSKGMNKHHKYIYNNSKLFAFTEDLILNTLISYPESWYETNIPLLSAKHFDAAGGLVVASNINRTIYLSTNDGSNWTAITGNGLPAGIVTVKNLLFTENYSLLLGVILSSGDYELYRIGYEGSAWSKIDISNIPGFYPKVIKNLSGSLFAVSVSNVWVSSNNGMNWSAFGNGLPTDTVTDIAAANNRYFCSTKHNGVYLYSASSGAWNSFNNGLGNLNVNALTGYFANLFAATDSGFYYADVYSGIENENSIPVVFSLFQNYPNPFNPVTKIDYTVGKNSMVKIVVYDVMGKEISVLVHGNRAPGFYSTYFDGTNLSAGVYFCRLESDNVSYVRKMLLVK
ncbi:MAG: T9SS type A sorting domain-containing protein [Ignavibacteria bacterium]|nr:T9SS type A sorting domain-containing protein [Ignavibacteria bacterium]